MQEEWKSIEGYEGKYEVSNLGRIKSLINNTGKKREKILKPRISKQGYLYLNLWRGSVAKSKKIHRIVAEAFCKKPTDAQCVNHINGVKTDNRAENLEWCTYSYNIKHAYKEKLITPTKGEKNGMYGVHGKDHPSSKPVLQFDLEGNYIKRWENCVEAGKCLGVNGNSISRCARGDRKKAYGFMWRYENDKNTSDRISEKQSD